jgi:hypothetical protein
MCKLAILYLGLSVGVMLGPCTAAKPPKLSERHTVIGKDQTTPFATLAAFAAFMLVVAGYSGLQQHQLV